jgi:hypothetical protein
MVEKIEQSNNENNEKQNKESLSKNYVPFIPQENKE